MTDWQLLAGLLLCFSNLVTLWRLWIIERKVERLESNRGPLVENPDMELWRRL